MIAEGTTADKITAKDLAKEIASILNSDPALKKEFLTSLLSDFKAPVPMELLDRRNLKTFAGSVITDRDIHQARMVIPEDAIYYACRDIARPRDDDAWMGANPGDKEIILSSELYHNSIKIIENTEVGGLVHRKHDRPIISNGKKVGTIKIPAETIDSMCVFRMDDGGTHQRDAIRYSTNGGRQFIWDPECPEDQSSAESKPLKHGRLSVTGGTLYTEGYESLHIYDREKKEFVEVPNVPEQALVRMGLAGAPIGNFSEPPAPFMFKDR